MSFSYGKIGQVIRMNLSVLIRYGITELIGTWLFTKDEDHHDVA
jgi:hypothetical protein